MVSSGGFDCNIPNSSVIIFVHSLCGLIKYNYYSILSYALPPASLVSEKNKKGAYQAPDTAKSPSELASETELGFTPLKYTLARDEWQ